MAVVAAAAAEAEAVAVVAAESAVVKQATLHLYKRVARHSRGRKKHAYRLDVLLNILCNIGALP